MRTLAVALIAAAGVLLGTFAAPRANAAPCPPPPERPIVVAFLGFDEQPGDGSHQLALELQGRFGADLLGPYLQAQNPVPELQHAVADVLKFDGQPFSLVKHLLTAAIVAGREVVNVAGLPVFARFELQRARREINRALQEDPTRPVYVVAYSWGTVSARLLLPHLLEQGANIQNVILLDPVQVLQPQNTFSPVKILDPYDRRLRVDEQLADRTLVIYQDLDPVIHGAPVVTDSGLLLDNTVNLANAPAFRSRYPECATALVACFHVKVPTDPLVMDAVMAFAQPPPACCGDGVVGFGEQCDDGNQTAGDGCRPDCTLELCGDGIKDPQEECDDGNTTDGDGCSSICKLEICGNGIVDFGEECDDGNQAVGDGCRPNCTIEACGDLIKDPQEQCDDGNRIAGDGCSSTCQSESPNLSGTWTICLSSYTTPPSIGDTTCFTCPPQTGCVDNGVLGAEFLPLPWCFALGFAPPQPIQVAQTGTSLSGSVTTASCPIGNSCIDTLNGSISGNTVEVVRMLTISASNFNQVMAYTIQGTVSGKTIIDATFSGTFTFHGENACSTRDQGGSAGTGPAQITISPAH